MRHNSMTAMETQPAVTEREWTVEGVTVLTARVELPQPVSSKDRTSRRIGRYYRAQGRAFLRYCEKWLLPQAKEACRAALENSTPLPVFRGEVYYRETYNCGGLWSLYTQSKEVIGQGKTLLCRRGDTWDLAEGFPVSMQSFFPAGLKWKRHLLMLAEKEMKRQECSGISKYYENKRKALRRQFNSRNFYLTEEGLTFFYAMHAIGPAAEGIPVFVLPYGQAGLQIQDDGSMKFSRKRYFEKQEKPSKN